METSRLLSFSNKYLLCIQWFLTNIPNRLNSCDLASSFKFLQIISQTHCVIICQNTEAILQTVHSTVTEHMFVMHICSYLATNQWRCHARGVCYFSQCHTWVCFMRGCLCVFWQPATEYTWQLTQTWQHVILLLWFDCSIFAQTQLRVCVCVLPGLCPLSLHSFRASWKDLADCSSSKRPLNRELSSSSPVSSSSTSTPSFTNNTWGETQRTQWEWQREWEKETKLNGAHGHTVQKVESRYVFKCLLPSFPPTKTYQ